MRSVVWIVILFAVAVGLVPASGVYTGNVYVVARQTTLCMNLHAFALGLIIAVVILYSLVRLIAGLLNIPGRMQRFGTICKSRQVATALNNAGQAFFEGKFKQTENEAAKVLANKEADGNRALALMLGTHAADQTDNIELRDRYLKDIEALPKKQRLSRYLLLAESTLTNRDYPAAKQNLDAAAQINPNLTKLVRLQLRYASDDSNAAEVLEKSEELEKAGAISDYEAEQYQSWAYRRLLASAADVDGLKSCLRRIPENLKSGGLCAETAEEYKRLGLYGQAVKWVDHYYPQTQQIELLESFVNNVCYLSDREQQQVIDTTDNWLQTRPDNAKLLIYLGQLAYGKRLWGKAQGYLGADIVVKPTVSAHLALAKVFDETEQLQKAEARRKLVLESVSDEEEPLALENK